MKAIRNIEEDLNLQKPVVFTIGFFDGVHLGHQAVLNRVKEIAKKQGALSAVITFINHPSEVVPRAHRRNSTLITPFEKIKLIEELGIDILFLVKFTYEFSQQTAEQFLQKLRKTLPFTHVVLGYDSQLGKNREGNKEQIQQLSKSMGFTVEYIEQLIVDGIPVSSTKIRELLEANKQEEAAKLLGRKLLKKT